MRFSGLLATGLITCNGQQPEFVKSVRIVDDYFGLAVRAQTNGWVALESSPDLRYWTEVANIATTNDVSLFVDEVNVNAGNRFYRLRLPGTKVKEAEKRWPARSDLAYHFQIERVSTSKAPYVLSGTVTVTNDQKTVSAATANGEPLVQPDPADFPSIEELFAALQAGQTAGCRQVYAMYDVALGFPFRCLIDQRVAAVPPADTGNAVEYRISALEFVPQTGSAEMPERRHDSSPGQARNERRPGFADGPFRFMEQY